MSDCHNMSLVLGLHCLIAFSVIPCCLGDLKTSRLSVHFAKCTKQSLSNVRLLNTAASLLQTLPTDVESTFSHSPLLFLSLFFFPAWSGHCSHCRYHQGFYVKPHRLVNKEHVWIVLLALCNQHCCSNCTKSQGCTKESIPPQLLSFCPHIFELFNKSILKSNEGNKI